MCKTIQTILTATALLSGLAISSASAQDSSTMSAGQMPGKKMSNQEMMDKMDKMSAKDKAAMFDKMTEKDKMAAMKMSGHDMTKVTSTERMGMMSKMGDQEKADMFDKMPMDKKMAMMNKKKMGKMDKMDK